MFQKSHESLDTKPPGTRLRGRRVVLGVGALFLGAAALIFNPGMLAAEPSGDTWRDDPSLNRLDPGVSSPQRQPPPGTIDFPGNPSNEESPPAARRFRSHDPEAAPPHYRSRHKGPAPAQEEQLPEREQIQRKLTGRYGNPAVVRLVRSMSAQQSLEVYLEVSGLIDARHLKPSTYDARVKQAAKNLCQALENPAFLRANGLDDPSRIEAFRRDVLRVAEGRPIAGADDAYQALQWTIQA